MVSNCANPKCHASFKYFGTGQLFISKAPEYATDAWQHELQWLCDSCADRYLFEGKLRPVAPVTNSNLMGSESISKTGDDNVLLDCANSACAAIFISPSQGKLFKFNALKQSPSNGNRFPTDRQAATGDDKESWYWLCDDCSRHMTLRLVRGHAEVVPIRHSMAA